MKKAYDTYDREKLEIVSIGVDRADKLKAAIKKHNLNWIQIHYKQERQIELLYQVKIYPFKYLINDEGIFVALGNDMIGEKLFETLEAHLNN